jgi:hypothetical protein
MKIRKSSSTKEVTWIPQGEFALGNSCKEDALAFKEALLNQRQNVTKKWLLLLLHVPMSLSYEEKCFPISDHSTLSPQMCTETLAILILLQISLLSFTSTHSQLPECLKNIKFILSHYNSHLLWIFLHH